MKTQAPKLSTFCEAIWDILRHGLAEAKKEADRQLKNRVDGLDKEAGKWKSFNPHP